jgi:predicted MFS family arabinose efflux permease
MTPPAHGSAARQTRALLLLLATANFAVGIGAFVVIGILLPVATAFGISEAEAGWLMTIYAIVYAVMSPVLVAMTGRMDRARVLIGALVLLLAGAVMAALAPSYGVLLAARALMAVGGGIITPVSMAVGAAAVEPQRRGKALATVYGGLTLSQALGVPGGAWLGYAFGWRVAFGSVAVLALGAAVVLYRLTPRGIVAQPTSLGTLGGLLASRRPMLAASFTVLFMSGIFMLYTYMAPFVEARHGLGGDGVSIMLLVFGLTAVVGNAMGGHLTDRVGSAATLSLLCVVQLVTLPLLTLTHLSFIATIFVLGVWSVFGWSVHVPQQARLSALDPAKAPVLLAMHAGGIYIGSSIGSAIGGQVLTRWGVDALGPVAAASIAAAFLSLGAFAWVGRTRADPSAS